MIFALALACAAIFAVAGALAAAPRIDRGFGEDGVARTSLPPQAVIEPFAAAADGPVHEAQEALKGAPDPGGATTAEGGRLVGTSATEGKGAVVRYRPDGSLDTAFGKGGTSEELPFGVEAVAPLPSGGALAAGKGILTPVGTHSEATYQVYVARLGADGKIDRGFGKAGIVELNTEDSVEGDEAVHVQARAGEGAEVVVGSYAPHATAVALGPSGKLDPGFGKGGKLTLPGSVVGAATAPGEALVVAGSKSASPASEGGSPAGFYVARYTVAGSLDPTYAGGAGIAVLDPGDATKASAALFGADGSVTLGGLLTRESACPPTLSCEETQAVVHFTSAGLPDTGFGEGGIVRFSTMAVPFASDYSYGVGALAPRPGGGTIVSATGREGAFYAALGPDGALDLGFGSGGIVTNPVKLQTSYANLDATGVDRAGDVFVLVGVNSGVGNTEGEAVMRYRPDGTLDTGFGEDGRAYVPTFSEAMAVAPDGSTYVSSAESTTLVKLSPSGSLDPSFGDDGSATLPHGEGFEPGSLVALGDGDLLVGGAISERHGFWPSVLRYLPDGRLDPKFGRGGIAVEKPRRSWQWELFGATLAVDGRGRILLAGGELHRCCLEKAALLRFEPDGRPDRSFGQNGSTFIGRGTTRIGGLALRGERILAAATITGERTTRDVLYEFDSDGRLDRGFGERGSAVARPRDGGRELYESVSVFSLPDRIVFARSYLRDPLVAFSPRGKLERGFGARLGGLPPKGPGDTRSRGPAVALDGDDLILAWTENWPGRAERAKEAQVSVQRLLLR